MRARLVDFCSFLAVKYPTKLLLLFLFFAFFLFFGRVGQLKLRVKFTLTVKIKVCNFLNSSHIFLFGSSKVQV